MLNYVTERDRKACLGQIIKIISLSLPLHKLYLVPFFVHLTPLML